MERVRQSIDLARNALLTLEEILTLDVSSDIIRDAAIQRFEYTFEAVWKAGKRFLLEVEGVDAASPKGTVRSFRELGLMTDAQASAALVMVNDRNLTVHTYNESVAMDIFSRVAEHTRLLRLWVDAMAQREIEAGGQGG